MPGAKKKSTKRTTAKGKTAKAWKARKGAAPQLLPASPRRLSGEHAELLLRAVNSVRDYAIFVMDATGHILTWNEGAERLKGYAPREIVGRHFSAFYTQPDLDRNHPAFELKEAKKHGRYEEEGWRLRKDGTKFWANIVITKLTNDAGELIGFSKVTRDLTTRREAEERLRISEERFRRLVAGVKDYAIFMLDPEGRVASWNEGAARIKGYKAEEILGEYFSVFYPAEDVEAGKCEYELREARLTGSFEDEGWRVRKDGTRLWANVVITALYDNDRNLLGFTKVTRDLTERRRAEEKLQRAYADLDRRVQERTQELAVSNARLEQREQELERAVAMRDEFLSIASHELKTPVTSLKLQMQMLRERSKPEQGLMPPPERIIRAVDSSLRQIDRLGLLIEDLLDVARASASKLEFQFERAELRPLVEEVVARHADHAQAAACTLVLGAEAGIFAQVDKFRLEQVLVNLLTNAFKYAPGTKVEVSLSASNGRASISVRDHGPGVPTEVQAKVFERFERAENARNISGLGLGLYISREIVRGHQGEIRLESQPGKGATFTVELPVSLHGTASTEVTQ